MPALVNHHLLGERVAPQLDASLLPDEESLLAFLLGCQGPDPFFFRFSTLPRTTAVLNQLGEDMHATRMSAFFDALRDACGHVPAADRALAQAFSLGMLCHYALDRVAHPFIFAKEYELLRADAELAQSPGQVHALLESELDVFMLWHERSATCADRPPASIIAHTPRIDRVAGAVVSQAALVAYGTQVEPSAYGSSVADMKFIYQVIEPAGSRRTRVIERLERTVRHGRHSLLAGLSHEVSVREDCPAANLDHSEWADVWTGETSTDSFVDRFELAAAEYPGLAAAFLDGTPGTEITGHRNYSGVLLDDEAIEAPEPEV